MILRDRLPNRRRLETLAIEHGGQRYKIGLGRSVVCDGSCGGSPRLSPIAEVFLNAQKVNSSADVVAHDGAILMSILLQFGCPPARIYHAMTRNEDGTPASPLGRAAAYLVEVDR